MADSAGEAQVGDGYQIAVDIGGTFTDGVMLDEASGAVYVAKSLTTYADPGEAVSTVVGDLLAQFEHLHFVRQIREHQAQCV